MPKSSRYDPIFHDHRFALVEAQQQIKTKLVELDFCNMDVAHFLEYIAKGITRIQNS